jgi:hypothetical protein
MDQLRALAGNANGHPTVRQRSAELIKLAQ